jgi:hypothetical protein
MFKAICFHAPELFEYSTQIHSDKIPKTVQARQHSNILLSQDEDYSYRFRSTLSAGVYSFARQNRLPEPFSDEFPTESVPSPAELMRG